ncbi:hypothetical protein HDA32_005150 [Spinactinospora alkalitolerans]|uniref:Secreted protein/lipoprotein n=1 Tax=Spinactinospora alkalitolerans TaxID=687207 RepID=A0A852U7X2_9ACTN|nr:hypothetical protein [Spinactinospora alkalitolerans]NYE50030.1 hypothetical protein [Spinactinospora alkalitolerans]
MAFGHRGATLAGGALVMAALQSCAALEGSESSPSPTPSPTPSDTGSSVEEAGLEAYENMWDVVIEASHNGEADPSDLDRYASGDALALMRQTLQGAGDDGVTVVGEPALDPHVTEVSPASDPDTVVILDCVDDSRWVEQGQSSPTESEAPDEDRPRKVDATVSHDGLAWRVSQLRIWEQGTC